MAHRCPRRHADAHRVLEPPYAHGVRYAAATAPLCYLFSYGDSVAGEFLGIGKLCYRTFMRVWAYGLTRLNLSSQEQPVIKFPSPLTNKDPQESILRVSYNN